MVVVVLIYLISVQWQKYVLVVTKQNLSDYFFVIKIASDIGPQTNELLMKKVQLSKEKQASWGHTNERLLFDDDNFV
jgi:hypothetical protein